MLRFYVFKKTSGIALLEVLIALIILLGGITALATYGASLVRTSSLAKQYTEGLNLAESKIEYFRSYETISSTAGKLAYNDIVSGSETIAAATGDNATYTRSWTVTTYNSSLNYKVVNVTVSWTDSANKSENIQLVSIIAEADPVNSGNVIG